MDVYSVVDVLCFRDCRETTNWTDSNSWFDRPGQLGCDFGQHEWISDDPVECAFSEDSRCGTDWSDANLKTQSNVVHCADSVNCPGQEHCYKDPSWA